MNILIACEESQEICKEFRKRGHNAFSCDIQPPSGGLPEYHICGNVFTAIYKTVNGFEFFTMDNQIHTVTKWDLLIAHPPCTYLTVTGNRWFDVEKYGQKAIERMEKRENAVKFFLAFTTYPADRIAIENPVGVMSTIYKKPTQIIQPWQFGEPFEKKTCLWLQNLPKLKPTHIVQPPPREFYPSGKSMPRWYSHANSKTRSKTFHGIAVAIAEQWGFYNDTN